MKRLFSLTLLLSALFCSTGFAQSTQGPDCVSRYSFSASGQNSATFTNFTTTTGMACAYWLNTYATTGTVNSLSLVTQAAPAGATPTTAGTFVTYPGMAIAGAITNTATAGASAFLWNDAASVPFIREHLASLSCTGSCLIYGVLQGWNEGNAAGAAAAAASSSGCPNPCTVIQPTAANLNAQVQGPAASGAALSGNPVLQGLSDGVNVNNAITCNYQVNVSIVSGTGATLITGTAAQRIRICHWDFVSNVVATFSLQEGTGTVCGTGGATLAGPYQTILTGAFDFGSTAPLVTQTTGDNVCIISNGTTVTIGGVMTYAKF